MSRLLIFIIINLVVLMPNFQISSNLPSIRIEDSIFIVIFLIILLQTITQKRYFSFYDRITILLLFVCYSAIFSLGCQETVFDQRLILADIMIFPMLFKYWIITQTMKYISGDLVNFKSIILALVVAGIVASLVGICQIGNIFNINKWLTPLYRVDPMVLEMLQAKGIMARAPGIHGDARRYGYFLVCFGAVLISVFLHSKDRKMQLVAVASAALVIWALILTLSRTAVLSLVLTLIFGIVLFFYFAGMRVNKVSYAFLILLLGFTAFSQFKTRGFEKRVMETETRSFERSKYARFRDFKTPFLVALDKPLIFLVGRGPSKAYLRTDAHNDWGWFFFRYGLPGLIAYVLLVFRALSTGIKNYARANTVDKKIVYLFATMIIFNWFVFAWAEDIFKDMHVMAFNMIFIGIIAATSTIDAKPLQVLSNDSQINTNV
jgi:hypothetical protein